jgi:NADH:ubiquinone oxidoreductase subunit 6 (subunit J)
MVYQIVSLVGAILILFAFGAQQLRKLDASTAAYQALNLVGGVCLWLSAMAARQYGFILLEGSWTIASAYGLWMVVREGRR